MLFHDACGAKVKISNMSKITPVSNYETLILPFITFSRVFVVKFRALKVAHNECFRIVKALSKSGKIVKISHLRR